MRTRPLSLATCLLTATCLIAAAPSQQRDFSEVQIETLEVADGIYMLVGAGGNIGLSVGEDGPFVVDDQFAPLTDKIKAAIAAVTDGEVRFVLNTHWHGDHTGGNENFGQAGALIVAHRNVRKRMNPEEFTEVMGRTQQAPAAALPLVTFTDEVTLYWNGEKIRAQHVEHAHTDGDTIIWFTHANVVHMGDTFFNARYPFIDIDSGGNLNGVIAAAEAVLARADADTKIIPGHGELAGVEALQKYHDVLVLARDRVSALIDEGKSLEQIIEAKPMAEYDEGWGSGFINGERFLAAVHRSLTGS